MIERYMAGAYWGARKESPEECARRASHFFSRLAEVDPLFAQWFKPLRGRKDTRRRILQMDQPTLERMIRGGKDRYFDELGYSFIGWNGQMDERDSASFHISCGGCSHIAVNSCLLRLPGQRDDDEVTPNVERIRTAKVMSGLVRCMAEAWEPEWAIATHDELKEMLPPTPEKDTFVGWVMYHANSRGPVPPLPEPVRVEPVEDKGTLIVLTPERFTVTNPEHVALARRVHLLLEPAGLLRPLRR